MTWESSSSTSPRNYRAPITLEVLPDEIGELPESDTYVRVEYIPPGRDLRSARSAPAFSRYVRFIRGWPGAGRGRGRGDRGRRRG
jgi:hypothetical protein